MDTSSKDIILYSDDLIFNNPNGRIVDSFFNYHNYNNRFKKLINKLNTEDSLVSVFNYNSSNNPSIKKDKFKLLNSFDYYPERKNELLQEQVLGLITDNKLLNNESFKSLFIHNNVSFWDSLYIAIFDIFFKSMQMYDMINNLFNEEKPNRVFLLNNSDLVARLVKKYYSSDIKIVKLKSHNIEPFKTNPVIY